MGYTGQVILPGVRDPVLERQPLPRGSNGVQVRLPVSYRQPRSWQSKKEFLKGHVHVGNN